MIITHDSSADWRNRDFVSESFGGLGYAPLYYGESVDNIEPYNDNGGIPDGLTSKEWTKICDDWDRYEYEHRHELGINPAGRGWGKYYEADRAKREKN